MRRPRGLPGAAKSASAALEAPKGFLERFQSAPTAPQSTSERSPALEGAPSGASLGAPKPASAAVEASKEVFKTFSGRVRHALDHVRAFFGARSRPQCADAFRLARHRRCRRSCSPARALLRRRALAIWRSSCARLLSLRFEGAVEVSKGVLKCFQAAHCWYVARARQTRPSRPPSRRSNSVSFRSVLVRFLGESAPRAAQRRSSRPATAFEASAHC